MVSWTCIDKYTVMYCVKKCITRFSVDEAVQLFNGMKKWFEENDYPPEHTFTEEYYRRLPDEYKQCFKDCIVRDSIVVTAFRQFVNCIVLKECCSIDKKLVETLGKDVGRSIDEVEDCPWWY